MWDDHYNQMLPKYERIQLSSSKNNSILEMVEKKISSEELSTEHSIMKPGEKVIRYRARYPTLATGSSLG